MVKNRSQTYINSFKPRSSNRKSISDILHRIAVEVVRHFTATIIIDKRLPVLMKTLARVSVFVEVSTVELPQAVLVSWEVEEPNT